MTITIIGPEKTGLSGYDVWLEASEDWYQGGLLLGSGPTKGEALTAAQQSIMVLARHMSELQWQQRHTRSN